MHGITKLTLVKSFRVGSEDKSAQEHIFLGRVKNEKIYRELVFTAVKGSKVKILTEPTVSKVTIDVEDIMKNEAVCSVFKFQNNDEDFGFIALRLQFFTGNPQFNKLRKERMQVL